MPGISPPRNSDSLSSRPRTSPTKCWPGASRLTNEYRGGARVRPALPFHDEGSLHEKQDGFLHRLDAARLLLRHGIRDTFDPGTRSARFLLGGSFPTGVTIALALLSLILVGRTITGKDKDTACWPERKLAVKVGLMAAWILAYVVGFIFLGEYAYDAEWPEGTGFLISTLIFLSGAQVLTGYRNPFYIFLISAGISAFLYAVFAIFFKVPLP